MLLGNWPNYFETAAVAKRSCSDCTVIGSVRSASIASRAASTAGIVVMHGTPCATAAARMRPSSVRAPLPLGVLMISFTAPSTK